MFKVLALSLALASMGRADVIGTTPVEVLNGGCYGVNSGSLTYALNQGLTGTSSSAVDLSGTVGLMVTLTSTGSSKVLVYFSNANLSYTTGASQMYSWNSPGSYCLQPKARYVSFYNAGPLSTNRVSAFYYTMVAPSVAVSGSSTVTGNVNAFITGTVKVDAQGTSVVSYQGGAWTSTVSQGNGLPGGLTSNSWLTSDNYLVGYLTTTAAGSAGRGGSYTAVALTSAYSMNVTFAAGINAPCIVTVYPGNSTPTAAYWNSMPGWLAPTTPLSVSTTPLMFTAGIGDFLNLSVTGSTNPVTFQVRYAPIY